MVMSWPFSSSIRGLRIVLVVDVVGPLGGGGGDEVDIVSVDGGLGRRDVADIVRLDEGSEVIILEPCCVREASRVDRV
jgi:hypothetical protein